MNEQTMVIDPGAERTQMAGSVGCPVCGEENAASSVWCAECGFRLGTEAGETLATGAGFTLSGDGQTYPLKNGENVVGRLNADVFLSDPSVSRKHATVLVSSDAVLVRDEGSSNGTKVAGVRIPSGTETPLRAGDDVEFGTVKLTLGAPEGWEPAEMPDRPEAVEQTEPADSEESGSAAASPPAGILTDGVQTYTLREGANSIGRRPENDVTIPDAYVSGRHAVITVRDGAATIADSGSSNGTFLDERRLLPGAEESVTAGALIRFGRVSLHYEAVSAETAGELSPGKALSGEDALDSPGTSEAGGEETEQG